MVVQICANEDYGTRDRLAQVVVELGGIFDETVDVGLGVGLNRFRIGDASMTIYIDNWIVDLGGPDDAVRTVLDAMNG